MFNIRPAFYNRNLYRRYSSLEAAACMLPRVALVQHSQQQASVTIYDFNRNNKMILVADLFRLQLLLPVNLGTYSVPKLTLFKNINIKLQGESKNIPHPYFTNILSMIRIFSQNFTSLLSIHIYI